MTLFSLLLHDIYMAIVFNYTLSVFLNISLISSLGLDSSSVLLVYFKPAS